MDMPSAMPIAIKWLRKAAVQGHMEAQYHMGIAYQVCSHGPISASPTACLLRGYGRANTQNDRL